MIHQLTVCLGGALTNWYFSYEREALQARQHASERGCIFLFGTCHEGAAPYNLYDTLPEFKAWLRISRNEMEP